jgi:glycine dehydrogenase subunit 1
MSYGGPHLGFFACKQEYLRQMPGRLCGETVDAEGKRGFVLTLSTREQHIRREKATSNICTNQGLCALAFTVHASLLGEEGIKQLARLNHERACALADALAKVGGVKIVNDTFFNEFVIELPKPASDIHKKLLDKNIIAGLPLDGNRLLVTATEMTTEEDIKQFVTALNEVV